MSSTYWQTQYQSARRKVQELEAERDALAAHVERLDAGVDQLLRASSEDEAYEAMAAINDALADEPTHSLARRDARVKAEALERAIKVMRQPMTDGGQPWLIRVEDVQAMAADYRQQAEGGGDE